MKRIGLLGGMSWESSLVYYRLVNEAVRERLGGLHSADCVLRSVDFAEIEALQRAGDWDAAGALLAREAVRLERAGAELLVLCTNTMHRVADEIVSAVGVPLVHIADATADAVRARGLRAVGLLGTAYTMEGEFYVGRLRDVHGLDVLVPRAATAGSCTRSSTRSCARGGRRRARATRTGGSWPTSQSAAPEAILLGCTEIDLLVGPGTRRCRSSTRPGCTPTAPSSWRSRRTRVCGAAPAATARARRPAPSRPATARRRRSP